MIAEKQYSRQCYFMGEATPDEISDWSPDTLAIANNGVFISKMQFNPIKLQAYGCFSDIIYFNKVIAWTNTKC